METLMKSSNLGGELISFKVDGIEKIHQGQEAVDENGKAYWKRHAPVLFPIVGKLKKGQTIINGRTYEMSQHGFARDLEFETLSKYDNIQQYVLRSNKYTLARFPYSFELYNTYKKDDNKLIVDYKVVNTGFTNMPFCIGGHPAFKIDPDDMERGNYYLEFVEAEPNAHFLYLVDGLVGTEYSRRKLESNQRIRLDGHTFDNDALIIKGIKNRKIILYNSRTNKQVLMMDYSDFPYLGIWSKPGAPFLCLEPWTATADRVNGNNVFAKKPDITIIPSGAEFNVKFEVEFY
jgi:galactose mutarotase-like enzyme